MASVEKVVFVSIFKEGEGGGEGRVAYEIARWFSHHYNTVMISPGATTGLVTGMDGFRQFRVTSISRGDISMPLLSAVHVRKIFKFLDDFNPDVIHIHDPAILGVVAQLWAKLNRVPVFYTAHLLPSRVLDFGTNEIAHILSSPLNEPIVEKYMLNFYQNCDAVVGLNQIASTEIREFGYAGPIFLIPNGRDLSLYHSCRYADIHSKEKILTFVGSLSKRKNQIFLFEVMKHLPANYQLHLVGDPLTPSYKEELMQVVREQQLNVVFSGQMDQKGVAKSLEKAHVVVSASRMEVQSLAIIEALASGTPVVGLSNETIDELVDESDGMCLPKDCSPEVFAAIVRKVCELDQKDYLKLCEAARNRTNDLDWSNIMTKTVQSYEKVLAKWVRRSPNSSLNLDLLGKYVAQIPAGKLHDEVEGIVASLSTPRRPLPPVNVMAIWMAWLNMTISTIMYYFWKVPLVILRTLRILRKR